MFDINDLFFFAKVVEFGGFSAASKALNLPKSKLSRRVGLLEERLGLRLIQRTSRQFMVTEIGLEYYRHCQAMLIEAEAAQEVIDRVQAEPQGIIRMTCPSAFLHFGLGEMITRFMAKYPKVKVYLEIKNRRVDLVREGFDLAVRVHFPPLKDSDVVVKQLAVSPQILVAHPKLLEGHTYPLKLEDLGKFPSVALGELHDEHRWCLDGSNGSQVFVPHHPKFIANDMAALYFAAVQGIGIAQLPTMMVHHELNRGELVEVVSDWFPRSGIVQAAFPSRRGLLPTVRALIDYLAAEFSMLIDAGQGYTMPGTGV